MLKKVAVVIGSGSDFEVIKEALKTLKNLQIDFEAHVISAHRTPLAAQQFASNAIQNGFGVIIAAAGKAAHLAGVLAAHTCLPVIGIPINSPALDGLDALLSTVQMPAGVPVATVAIDGAQNAAILAAQILAVNDEELANKLCDMKEQMAKNVAEKDLEIQNQINFI